MNHCELLPSERDIKDLECLKSKQKYQKYHPNTMKKSAYIIESDLGQKSLYCQLASYKTNWEYTTLPRITFNLTQMKLLKTRLQDHITPKWFQAFH